MQIYIVEPDADLSGLLAFILRHAGHEVTTTGSLAAAVPLIGLAPPSLMVLRVELPDLGTPALRLLLHARARRPTLVLTTANPAWVAGALGLPAENCFALPLQAAALQRRLTDLEEEMAG